jgi:tetratricopeptide (TPR) repeat protein
MTGSPDVNASATGHASVAISGSNYAPIDTQYHVGVNVYTGRRLYDIVELAPQAATVPSYLRRQPSRLLGAAHRIVDFQGRKEELAQLAEWRNGRRSFDLCLVYGAGGQGKSRLAMKFAGLSAEAGWLPFRGSLAPAGSILPAEADQLPSGESGRLVVVDYAERWPVALLRSLLGDARLHDAPTRVLLLARPAGNWWRHIRTQAENDFQIFAEQIQLKPLPAEAGDRERLFANARDKFSVVLGVTGVGNIKPPPGWPNGATALDIQMAALAGVYAVSRNDVPPDQPGSLSSYLLERELEHWAEMHRTAGRPTTPESMGRAVYLACLTGPLRHDEASGLLSATDVTARGAETNHLLDDHRLCYPALSGGMTFLPLQPDRLSEDFIALLSANTPVEGFEPDPWTVGKLTTILDALGTNTPAHTESMLMKAVAVAQRWKEFAQDHLGPLIIKYPNIMLSLGGPLLSALADVHFFDAATIATLESQMPLEGPPDFMDFLAALTGQLYYRLRGTTPNDEVTVAMGLRLAHRLIRAGRHVDAVEPIEAVVRQLHKLRPHDDPQHQAKLAVALGCMAEAYHGVGRMEDALAAAEMAIKRWRASGAISGEADASLAATLSVRARLMYDQQRYKEAIQDEEEVAAIWEVLSHDKPSLRLKLAYSLKSLAIYCAAVGQGRRAHEVAEQAIARWRDLVAANPSAHQVDLLDLLLLIGEGRMAPTNRRLEAVREASSGFWWLWKRDITLLPRAARASVTLAEILNQTGHYEAARAHSRRARNVAAHLYDQDAARHVGLSLRCNLAYARSCLDSRQSLEDGLRAAFRAAEHARSVQSPLAADIDRVTAGLLRALGREADADRLLGLGRVTPRFDGAFERAAKVSSMVEHRPFEKLPCAACGGTGVVRGEVVGYAGALAECPDCWERRRQRY